MYNFNEENNFFPLLLYIIKNILQHDIKNDDKHLIKIIKFFSGNAL